MEQSSNSIKAYIQKHSTAEDIVSIFDYFLGGKKKYTVDEGKEFDSLKPISSDNHAFLSSSRFKNAMDIYHDEKGVMYILFSDDADNQHGLKINSASLSPILKGESLCVEFGNTDSISIALAVKIVNVYGGVVTFDDVPIHKCSNAKAELKMITATEARKIDNNEMSCDVIYYRKKEVLRSCEPIKWDFVESLMKANPDLDTSKESRQRLEKLKEYLNLTLNENKFDVEVKKNKPRF